MKLTTILLSLLTATINANSEEELDAERIANTVILDKVAVQNLQLETEMVKERTFERTVFVVGRIEEIPSKKYSISSRIPGKVVELNAIPGDQVKKGDVLINVESRQSGSPPPTISLSALADGLLVDSHVQLGQPVEPDTDLLDITDRSTMWAVAKIPEQASADIQLGATARIFIPALGGKPVKATLTRYGVTADAKAGTVEGVFEIPNLDRRLLPGMRAEFSVILDHRENILAAPRSAVQGDPSKRVMYVKDFELPHAFIRSPVVLGEENDQYVEVISGLFPGDDVVTRGSYSLGFAGSGSGMSLKDALDAAHGHEHNEDGSEITEADKTNDHHEHTKRAAPRWLIYYAVAATFLCLFLIHKLRTKTRGE